MIAPGTMGLLPQRGRQEEDICGRGFVRSTILRPQAWDEVLHLGSRTLSRVIVFMNVERNKLQLEA